MNSPAIMLVIWICVAVFAAIIEALTVSIVSCWFSIGAIFAIGAYFLGCNAIVQLIVFVVVSAITLLIIRPILSKRTKNQAQATNADMLIGQNAIVVEKIDNIAQSGAVKINGLVWTARSEYDNVIEENKIVQILQIEGAKLIVKQN